MKSDLGLNECRRTLLNGAGRGRGVRGNVWFSHDDILLRGRYLVIKSVLGQLEAVKMCIWGLLVNNSVGLAQSCLKLPL